MDVQQQTLAEPENNGFKLQDFALTLLANWYWILLSVIVALVCAVLIVMHTTPTYTRNSSLLIKSDENGRGGSNMSLPTEFQNLGLVGSNTNINNEIETISAPVLVEEAVRRLHLDVQMSVKQGLHAVPLYENAPVQLLLPQAADDEAFSFMMRLNRNQTAELWDFKGEDGNVDSRHLTVRMGTLSRTPLGIVLIQPTPYFGKNFTDEDITVSKSPVKAVGASYCGRLSVTLSQKESTILNITLTDASPKRADDLIFKLIDVYNEQWLKDRNRVAESTYVFITDRLNTLSKELGDVDQKISDYKSAALLPDVDAASALYMSESAKNSDQLILLNNQLGVAKYIRQYLSDGSKTGQYLPTNTGIGSTGIEEMIAEYNKVVSTRNELLENTSESSPFVQKANNDLALQKTAIIHSLDNFITQLQEQVRSWQGNEAATNQKLATAPRQVKQLLSVGRQQKVKEALYIYLLQKREENELSKTFTAWNTRIIQPPMGSSLPSSPRKSMMLMAALVIGICVPVGILYLRETLNNSVRGRADLDGMQIPLIGEVPSLSAKKHWWQLRKRDVECKICVRENSRDLVNEAFRVLRTKLDYFMGSIGGNAKVIMVTSFNPGSGKSFICANLGKVLSLKDQKVLVIDMDFRRCTQSAMAGSPRHGITDFLSGHSEDFQSLICREALGKDADMLPVGIVPPNPSELLLSPKLATLFEWARSEYDYVLLDCPPIDIVADTSIVKKYTDASLFVVRVGLMDRRLLKDVDELYTAHTYRHMALLLNGVEFVSSRYGSYRYGYGYGYGKYGPYAHNK